MKIIVNNFGYTCSFFKTFLSIHVALSLSEVAKKYLNYQDSKQVIRIKKKLSSFWYQTTKTFHCKKLLIQVGKEGNSWDLKCERVKFIITLGYPWCVQASSATLQISFTAQEHNKTAIHQSLRKTHRWEALITSCHHQSVAIIRTSE